MIKLLRSEAEFCIKMQAAGATIAIEGHGNGWILGASRVIHVVATMHQNGVIRAIIHESQWQPQQGRSDPLAVELSFLNNEAFGVFVSSRQIRLHKEQTTARLIERLEEKIRELEKQNDPAVRAAREARARRKDAHFAVRP